MRTYIRGTRNWAVGVGVALVRRRTAGFVCKSAPGSQGFRASTRNSRLVQVCVIDHTSPLVAEERRPHLHLQFLFSGHTRTTWAYVDTDLATLNEVILSWSARSRHRIRLRVHLHEEMPSNGGPACAEAVAALPRLVLQQASAERLSADGYDACPICLDKYDAGDEVVCMPCSGNHISHAPCLVKWLATASTCPSCRFMLPSKGSAPSITELHDLCAGARAALERIRRNEAAPCPPCDPESSDDAQGEDASQSPELEAKAAILRNELGLRGTPAEVAKQAAATLGLTETASLSMNALLDSCLHTAGMTTTAGGGAAAARHLGTATLASRGLQSAVVGSPMGSPSSGRDLPREITRSPSSGRDLPSARDGASPSGRALQSYSLAAPLRSRSQSPSQPASPLTRTPAATMRACSRLFSLRRSPTSSPATAHTEERTRRDSLSLRMLNVGRCLFPRSAQ